MPTTPGHGEKLSRKQESAIAALLECGTVRKAAARAGVTAKTLSAWSREPGFQAAYADARRRLLRHAVGRLAAASDKAVARLVKALRSAKDGDAIRAAVAIIDKAVAGGQLLDVLGRIEALEALAKKYEARGGK